MLIVWFLAACLMMCFVEYIAHRWVMHNKFTKFAKNSMNKHLILHHGRYFKVFDYEKDPSAKYISLHIDWLFNIVGLSPIILGILFLASVSGGIVVATVVILHGIIWNIVHDEMHMPSNNWLTNNQLFILLRHYHYLHHKHPNRNFNAVLPPLADWVFGTLIWIPLK